MIVTIYGITRSRQIRTQMSGVIVFNKESKKCQIIDFSVPYDTRVNSKLNENVENCQDLARELKKLWIMTAEIILVVMCSLRTATRKLKKALRENWN